MEEHPAPAGLEVGRRRRLEKGEKTTTKHPKNTDETEENTDIKDKNIDREASKNLHKSEKSSNFAIRKITDTFNSPNSRPRG